MKLLFILTFLISFTTQAEECVRFIDYPNTFEVKTFINSLANKLTITKKDIQEQSSKITAVICYKEDFKVCTENILSTGTTSSSRGGGTCISCGIRDAKIVLAQEPKSNLCYTGEQSVCRYGSCSCEMLR